MPANDYKPVAIAAGAVILSQAAYEAFLASNPNGWPDGIVPADRINKTMRQASVMSSALAQFVSDALAADVLDPDAGVSVATITAQILAAVTAIAAGGAPEVRWVIAGGSANAITATYSPAVASLTDGLLLWFRATAANSTTTPTFAPNGLTAHTITKKGGVAVAAGDIPGNLAECILRYNLASTRWELLNPAGGTGALTAGFQSAELTITANSVASAAHGLGGIPTFFAAYIKCKIAELGYSVDDLVIFYDDDGTSITGPAGFADATNVGVPIPSAGSLAVYRKDSTHDSALITNANWKVVLVAYR